MSESDAKALVLVVDDDRSITGAMRAQLESNGYEVLTASTGIDGLVYLKTHPVDVVLLDFNMPGLSGIQILQEIRRERSQLSLPVLLVTGRHDSKDVVTALQSGANDYITKPVDFPILMARVATQLALRIEEESYIRDSAHSGTLGELVPGGELAGRYDIVRAIGRGGFGNVFEALQRSTGQRVAIKAIHSEGGDPLQLKQWSARFETEQRVLAQTRHPHIVKLLDSGRLSDGHSYVVLDFIDGHTLSGHLKLVGPLSAGLVKRLMRQVLDALSCAHNLGVVHSDLTPANIMITTTGSLPNVHVLDFGISHLAEDSVIRRAKPITETMAIIGSPMYMAPEQFESRERTSRSDVYAWGLVLAECLLGTPIQAGRKPLQIAVSHRRVEPVELPRELLDGPFASLLKKVLQHNPANRYTHITEVFHELNAVEAVDDYRVLTHPVPSVQPLANEHINELVTDPTMVCSGPFSDHSTDRTIVAIPDSEEDD
jgi:serine/threonine protein kinase/FixJ family two-component response regulator